MELSVSLAGHEVSIDGAFAEVTRSPSLLSVAFNQDRASN